jgi:hypothetical protein
MYHDEIIYNMTNQLIEREWINFSESKVYNSNIDDYCMSYYNSIDCLSNLHANAKSKYNKLADHLSNSDKELLQDFEEKSYYYHLKEKSSIFKYAVNLAIEELSFINKSEIELKLIKAISNIKDDYKLNSLYILANKLANN